jgi:hypothetical protein
MFRRKMEIPLIATALLCSLSLGCGLTLGPRTQTNYVMMGVGAPGQVVEQRTVLLRPLTAPADSAPYKQDISGWIVMPEPHWRIVKRVLDQNAARALEK